MIKTSIAEKAQTQTAAASDLDLVYDVSGRARLGIAFLNGRLVRLSAAVASSPVVKVQPITLKQSVRRAARLAELNSTDDYPEGTWEDEPRARWFRMIARAIR